MLPQVIAHAISKLILSNSLRSDKSQSALKFDPHFCDVSESSVAFDGHAEDDEVGRGLEIKKNNYFSYFLPSAHVSSTHLVYLELLTNKKKGCTKQAQRPIL